MGRSGPTGSVNEAQVELHLAGTFKVIRDGAELTGGQLGSRKSRTLLKLLAVERRALVPVDRIVEVLWPGEPPAAPEQNVATLVSRLRGVLGTELIQGGRHGYRLAAGPGLVVDLDAAARLCYQAEGRLATAAALALTAAERAHDILAAGTAISDEPYADWADPAREQVRELLRRVRLAAAEAALATGDPRRAVGYAEAAMAADPLDEAAHRWYMSASAAGGEQGRSIELARKCASDAGVADRVNFEVATAATFSGTGYDLAATFDCLHDMGDPLSAARHVRQALKPDGTWLIVEPYASDQVGGNMNPVGRVYYNASALLCVPNALSQSGGYALGAQAGEAAIRQVVTDAGFTRFRRAAQTPFNLVYEVRP